MTCQDQGVVLWDYTRQAGQYSQKNVFAETTTSWQATVVQFSWCWLVCLCHVIKTTKMADKLEKALAFQIETNILHYYKGILLLKLLWQNQNYQLVLCGSRDWSFVIWLPSKPRCLFITPLWCYTVISSVSYKSNSAPRIAISTLGGETNWRVSHSVATQCVVSLIKWCESKENEKC